MKHFILRIKHLIAGMTACNSVVTAKVDELLDVISADIVAATEDNCVDSDFSPEFKAFHSVESSDNVAAYSESSVIFKEHNVVPNVLEWHEDGTSEIVKVNYALTSAEVVVYTVIIALIPLAIAVLGIIVRVKRKFL